MVEYIRGKQNKIKFFIIIATILIAINGILSMLILTSKHKSKTNFSIEGDQFKYISKTENSIIFKDKEENIVEVIIENKSKNIISFATNYKIYYKDKVIESDASSLRKDGYIITKSDGDKYTEIVYNRGLGTYARPHTSIENLSYDVVLVNHIEETVNYLNDRESSNNNRNTFLLSSLVMLIGTLGVAFPEGLWKLEHLLSVKGGEPSEFYIGMTIIGGIITIVVAFALNFAY